MPRDRSEEFWFQMPNIKSLRDQTRTDKTIAMISAQMHREVWRIITCVFYCAHTQLENWTVIIGILKKLPNKTCSFWNFDDLYSKKATVYKTRVRYVLTFEKLCSATRPRRWWVRSYSHNCADSPFICRLVFGVWQNRKTGIFWFTEKPPQPTNSTNFCTL